LCTPENSSLEPYFVGFPFALFRSTISSSELARFLLLALRCQHVRRKLQIHHPGHFGAAFGCASPAATADIIPGAEHAVHLLRARSNEQLHREPVRRCSARARRRTRDGHPQFEARDQSWQHTRRVAQRTVFAAWAVDTMGRRDHPRHDGWAGGHRSRPASKREGVLFCCGPDIVHNCFSF
jgi:hypothetical protein